MGIKNYELDDDFDDLSDFDEETLDITLESANGYQLVTTYNFDGSVVGVRVNSEENDKKDSAIKPLAGLIDHTILKADATIDQVMKICSEAKENNFASVCVNSCWVRLCSELLRGSGVKVCSVVGFPLGAMMTEAKVFEAECAINNGAQEIDMVINVGALKSKDYELVSKEIHAMVDAAKQYNALVKVIIETCLLTEEEKVIACLISKSAGADFVKTSTGFSTGGATVEDVALMRGVVGEEMGVKASGGIRTKADAEAMVKAGASRIGASSGVKIINE